MALEAPPQHLVHHREVVLPLHVAQRELAVVRLLGHAALEDDHGAHDVLLAEVGDVVALDAQRQALEAEAVAQALERLDARRAAARQALDLGLRGQLGVALRQLAAGGAWGRAWRRAP